MTESAVLVGDAALPAGAKVRFTHRDGVGLDERKIAIPKAKYDFETAECSVPYTAVIEWSGWSDDPALPLLDALLAGAAADGLAFGGRTTRGYGRMAADVCKKAFHFPADVDAWLAFDSDDVNSFADATPVVGRETFPQEDVLCAELRMMGSFIVRRYTSDVSENEDKNGPDYCALENGKVARAAGHRLGRCIPPPYVGHAGRDGRHRTGEKSCERAVWLFRGWHTQKALGSDF